MSNPVVATAHLSGEFQPAYMQGASSEMGRMIRCQLTFASSYTSGGDTFDFSPYFGSAVFVALVFTNATKYVPGFVATNRLGVAPTAVKVKLIDSTSGSEVSGNMSDIGAFDALVFGW